MKKNFLFLGFAIPNEEMDNITNDDKFPQVQTHKFIWNFIKGIEASTSSVYTYISARPVTDYPSYPKKKIKRKKWIVNLDEKNIEITEIPFINTTISKLITRFFSATYYCFKMYHKSKNKSGVIVYSVHIPFMLTGFIISKVYRINYIAIWTDSPSIGSAADPFIKRKLRKIEFLLARFLMKKASKVIALTKYLSEDFAEGKPYLVVEGIIDENDTKHEQPRVKKQAKCKRRIIYTGALQKRYGMKNIVEGFQLLNRDDIVLEIYGRGDYEKELKAICATNENISYKGFVANREILKIQKTADFLINARSTDEEYVKYSFPSKTLEYMLSGNPLITTMLPGIPDEYRQYVFVLKDNKPMTIANMIESVCMISKDNLRDFGAKARAFAMSRSCRIQGKKIIEFIEKK